MYNNKTYVILDVSDLEEFDFSDVLNVSKDYLRYNLAGDKALLKYEGNTPESLKDKVKYTHEEILTIVNGSDWLSNDE
tara:strand:- start:2 stop:235 length:234 start_codon:yes stop_codon:yes gene_type:complete